MIRHKPFDRKARSLLAAIHLQTLQELLPEGYTFEFNEERRILNILSNDPPRIVAQPQFTRSQWYVLLTLCVSFPHHAPYENLLSCLTELSVAQCRYRIQQAQQADSQALKRELKPIRSSISGVRVRLEGSKPSLAIRCFHDAGYILARPEENEAPVEQ